MSYITMSNLTISEGLGSQMYHFASLFAISKFTGHKIYFFEENNFIGKGLLLNNSDFPNIPIHTPKISDLSPKDSIVFVYPISKNVLIDTDMFLLDPNSNYNFTGLFHTYKLWMPVLDDILSIYKPSEEVLNASENHLNKFKRKGRQLVSVHVRRGDYLLPLNSFFNNLDENYFYNAMKKFNNNNFDFLIFSDDIEWCKGKFGTDSNIYYSEGLSPLIDMFSMSLCDHNIISNSSFGMWSAIFNKNPSKKVICPAKYFKNDASVPFFNYAWFPDHFTPIF